VTDLLQVLLDMRSGAVAADCNKKFSEVLQAVLETGGKGELTMKLFIEPSKMGMGGAVIEVETRHECKLKKPELAAGKSFFFVTRNGDLSRDDPDQIAMFEAQGKAREQNR
jgi:hypothetical protein